MVDEAAMALEAAVWLAALRAKKLVLAGDHCQVPPPLTSFLSTLLLLLLNSFQTAFGVGFDQRSPRYVRPGHRHAPLLSSPVATRLRWPLTAPRAALAVPVKHACECGRRGTREDRPRQGAPAPTAPLCSRPNRPCPLSPGGSPFAPPPSPRPPPQLPPTVKSEAAARGGLGRTLFERLLAREGDTCSRLLAVQ